MNIRFELATPKTRSIISHWLSEPHMQEFWDNSQEHRDDIDNFIYGRPQTYFAGTTKYWVGFADEEPYCFILSDEILASEQNLLPVLRQNLSKSGRTISLDFGIGNTKFLGKGLAAKTLVLFMEFYRNSVDAKVDTFFIDPDDSNPRARHVYEQAGFRHVGDFLPTQGAFIGQKSNLMVRTFAIGS